MATDPVEAVISAFLDHLEHGGPEPSFDHLADDDRRRAEELVQLINDGRGIDVYRSRPSLDSLLSGSEFEDWLTVPETEGLSIDAVRADIVSALGSASGPIADGAALNEGIRSDVVVRYAALRIRLQFRDDIASPSDLALVDPRVAAGPVFGRFSDCPAVVLVMGDRELSSVAIDPFDTEEFIGTPDGVTYPPRISRPVLPLVDTLRRLVDELAPDLSVDDLDADRVPLGLDEIIESECDAAGASIRDEGRRSRTAAKQETWSTFDEHSLLAGITRAAASGELTDDDLEARMTTSAAA